MSTFKVNLICAVLCVVFAAALGFGDKFRRKVSLELNPGLNPPASLPPGVALVHARGLGLNDTLHFLLCNLGAPALLLVHTNSTESEVKVDWPVFINGSSPGSLKVAPESSVQYRSALVFTRLWEYDDVNNTADPQQAAESSFYPPYELQDFIWSDQNHTANESDHMITMCGGERTESFLNGSLCLKFSVFDSAGRDHPWPSLLHNANSSQLRVWMDGVRPRGNSSRFLLEFQSVGDSGFQGRVDVRSSIDDEYTPSIFKVLEWVSSPLNSSSVRGFSQWKPVAYRKPSPLFEDATPCRHSPLEPLSHIPKSAVIQAYFRDQPQVHGLNFSFGVDKDPAFYSDTEYISWTVLMGLGEPPADSFSALIIIIIAIGLGTPLAIIIVGGVFVCIRKRMTRSSGYEPIN
ncbi:glycosylated lysosomal membrane protein [Pseudorasbora parva]|uniref:glycosylated lysosomal membrane protein n=1 Tax=Pseudorasbora parva TaxID=51549 RepID=UPI00351E2342